jgi:hypothetical protein
VFRIRQQEKIQNELNSKESKESQSTSRNNNTSDSINSVQTSLGNASTSSAVNLRPPVSPLNIQRCHSFEVNNSFLDNLVSMGFPQNRAKKALILTGNISTEMAINWYNQKGEKRN